ncbi:N-acetylglucosamine-6-phosphate deacetylase [Sphingobacterium lactis]|uniref:N-acetylglucosamine-6-phosphate deacetylase n=1 Tax=Sphingobacterium lactis TaxID=797291 RepID=A0A1H5SSV4_9SPHI|nr:N-acetylglucosamine-6-phosphate deacetylase [Sphingobacterium lactis]SEF53028.1 N-acetylglucosamine-6-phosphate deacetylase [Sphingobacterium lactis]
MKSKTAYINGIIYTEYQRYEQHALLIDDDKVAGIVPQDAVPESYVTVDVEGANICPGLIDLQIYGTGQDLFSADLTKDSIARIEQQLLQQGCTAFNLTLATNTLDVFREAITVYKEAAPKVSMGLHLEGPFLNPIKRGAHPAELIKKASIGLLSDVLEGNEEWVTMMTIAPEVNDQECIDYLIERGILVSAGHSAATYKEATLAFDHGVRTVTHLWNAMSPLHHRDVGLPGAAFNHDEVCASIIADGVHVDFEAIRISKEMMGERLFLITDAVGACEKGIYKHVLNGDHFVLPDGTLSGSAMTMLGSVRNCVQKVGIPLDEALRMAILYPARLMDRHDIGNLNSGSIANVLFFDNEYQVKRVLFQGEQVV